jgi:hypothetical protein
LEGSSVRAKNPTASSPPPDGGGKKKSNTVERPEESINPGKQDKRKREGVRVNHQRRRETKAGGRY